MKFTRRQFLATSSAALTTLSMPRIVRAAVSDPNILKFVPSTALPALDPITATTYVIRNHAYMIYDTLFAMDSSLSPQPQMVEAWETSPDGLTWTFRCVANSLSTPAFDRNDTMASIQSARNLARLSESGRYGRCFPAVDDRDVPNIGVAVKVK